MGFLARSPNDFDRIMAKHVCETTKSISIQDLKRRGYLQPTYRYGTFSWSVEGVPSGKIAVEVEDHCEFVRFTYALRNSQGERVKYDYTLSLTTTPCYFGGHRYWFVCSAARPGHACGRRVGVLYLVNGKFGCRHCFDLAYHSQQVTHTDKWNFFTKLLSMEEKLWDDYDNIRVKYWHGRPTKRFARWLKRAERFSLVAPNLVEQQSATLDLDHKIRDYE